MRNLAKIHHLIVVMSFIFVFNSPFANNTLLAAQDEQIIVPVLLCPQGCGPLEGDTILGGLIGQDKETNIILRPQETPGYLYNLIEMNRNENRWNNTVFSTEDDILIHGSKRGGTDGYRNFIPEKITASFKLLYGEAIWAQGHFWVTFNPDYKSIKELKGKELGLGLRTQSDWGFNAWCNLKYGYDITSDNSELHYLGPANQVQEILDGKVDAITMGLGIGADYETFLVVGPLRELEASGRNIQYIGMEDEVINSLNKRFDTSYLSINVPAGTMPRQEQDINVGADRGYKACHESFSEEVAYDLVMQVAKHAPEMKQLHGLWKIWSPKLMVMGLTEDNAHPGAIKAYKELGWWELRKDTKPVELH